MIVKPNRSAELFGQADMDGGLIGQGPERVSLDEQVQTRRISVPRLPGIVSNSPKAENPSASVEAKGFLHG